MKRLSIIALALFALSAQTKSEWVTLFNGKDLNLVSKENYGDFQIRVEFYAGPKSNSGVYMRCLDGSKITDKTCYEANVYDNRPDQSGRTGGIPNYAPPIAKVDAEGKWNTYDITVQGDHIVVILNGTKTVDAHDKTLSKPGPIALQYQGGDVKFRSVQIRRLYGAWGKGRGVIAPYPLPLTPETS